MLEGREITRSINAQKDEKLSVDVNGRLKKSSQSG